MNNRLKHIVKKIFGQNLSKDIGIFIHKTKNSLRINCLRFIKQSKDIYTDYQLICLGEKKQHSFFGYYDITPFNPITDEVIYLILDKQQKNANIILENLELKTKNTVATTKVWNWQQGCRLRWLPNSTDEIIFNDFKDEKYYTRIINVRTNEEITLDFPLYDINKTGTIGVTLDFARLGVKRPGYGYTLMPYNEPENLSVEGIALIDIEKNTYEKLLTYQQIAEKLKVKNLQYKDHYLNHLSFSPSGNKFLFFYLDASTIRHEAYMLVYDLCEKELKVIEPEMKVSHYVWEDDDHIVATSYDKQMKCGYYRYFMDGKKEQISSILLDLDGHPSLYKNDIFLTDTYPDKTGYQSLFLFSEHKQTIRELVKIFSSLKHIGEKRTDLHPRFNKDKTKISFDANINGTRKFYYFNI